MDNSHKSKYTIWLSIFKIGKLSGVNKILYWALKVLYSIQFLISIVPITCTFKVNKLQTGFFFGTTYTKYLLFLLF